MTLSWSLDKIGVLARTAEDCATVLASLSARLASDLRLDRPSRARRRGDRRGVRVALAPSTTTEVAPSLRATIERAVDEFRQICPDVIEVELQRDAPYAEAIETIMNVELAHSLRDRFADPAFSLLDARQTATLRAALATPATTYLRALEVAAAARRAFGAVFQRADVILAASRPSEAPPLVGERAPRTDDTLSDALRSAGNLAGMPAVSLPCGLSVEAMPVGLQVVGPRGSDALLLSLAAAYQRATQHHLLRPPEGPESTAR